MGMVRTAQVEPEAKKKQERTRVTDAATKLEVAGKVVGAPILALAGRKEQERGHFGRSEGEKSFVPEHLQNQRGRGKYGIQRTHLKTK